MLSLDQLAELCARSVKSLHIPSTPETLYGPIDYMLDLGGKRIRPLLTLAACHLFSDRIERAVWPAIGIEVFHNFTLLHDDIMDKADVRRGRPTVHRKWSENVAILSGDAMMIMAYDCIGKTDPDILPGILGAFNRTALEVCEGQIYDMEFEDRADVTVEEYLRMIELKTSRLLAGAIEIGALAGGADPAAARVASEFGNLLGLAFQIQDDLLDTFGDEKTFGKAIGGDILCNKKTYLLIRALEMAEGEDRKVLREMLRPIVIGPAEKIEIVRNIYIRSGAKGKTEEVAEAYYAQAVAQLENLTAETERKAPLRQIAASILGRNK